MAYKLCEIFLYVKFGQKYRFSNRCGNGCEMGFTANTDDCAVNATYNLYNTDAIW